MFRWLSGLKCLPAKQDFGGSNPSLNSMSNSLEVTGLSMTPDGKVYSVLSYHGIDLFRIIQMDKDYFIVVYITPSEEKTIGGMEASQLNALVSSANKQIGYGIHMHKLNVGVPELHKYYTINGVKY